MRIKILKTPFYNKVGRELGCTVIPEFNETVIEMEKSKVVLLLQEYAFDELYPGQRLNVYVHIEPDTPWITVLMH